MTNASASLADCVRAIDAGESELVLDALDRSDSSAVAVLLAALRHAQVTGRTVTLSGMPAEVGTLAKLYGVDAMWPVAPVPAS